MVGGISSLNIPSLSYTGAQYGKMSLPVDSSLLIYSNFEHVSGMAAPEGTRGVSISKLNLLDVLIGMVSRINKTPVTQAPANADPTRGVDKLIENIENQIRQAQTASEKIPYYPSPNAESGILFNFSL
jgi:hypothetical protein